MTVASLRRFWHIIGCGNCRSSMSWQSYIHRCYWPVCSSRPATPRR